MKLPQHRLDLMLFAVATLAALAPVPSALACSRAVYEGPNGTVVTTRSNDWIGSQGTHLWMYPRGIQRDGANGPGSKPLCRPARPRA